MTGTQAGFGCQVLALGYQNHWAAPHGHQRGLQGTPDGFGVKNPPVGCFGGDGGKGEGVRERKRMGEAMLEHRCGPAAARGSYLKSRPWETSADVRFLEAEGLVSSLPPGESQSEQERDGGK